MDREVLMAKWRRVFLRKVFKLTPHTGERSLN